MKTVLIAILSLSIQVALAASSPGYTLIDSVTMKTFNGLDCEIAVAMSNQRDEVRVLRLDPRKGTYSVNYFAKSPELFGKYGISERVDSLITLKGRVAKTIQSSMDFKDGKRDVTLAIHLDDGSVESATIRIDNEFFKDSPTQCLK